MNELIKNEKQGRQRPRTRLYMTPANNVLVGRYPPRTANVHIVTDSRDAPFSIELPSLGMNEETAFWFNNINATGSGYDVTITGVSINKTSTSYTIRYGERAMCVDSMNGTYLLIPFRTDYDSYVIDYLQFNLDTDIDNAEGVMNWNSDDGVLEYGLPGGNCRIQIGMELLMPRRVKNKTGSTIYNGQPVYTSGGTWPNTEVALAKADNFLTAMISGLATEDIENNHTGWVCSFGVVRGDANQPIDTSMYSESDLLYLSATVAGTLTTTIPEAPNTKVFIGRVWRSHSVEGEIFILPIVTQPLSGLSDVYGGGSESDKDILQWNAGNSRWEMTKEPQFTLVKQDAPYYAYGGFQDESEVISIGSSYTWEHVTNAGNDLFTINGTPNGMALVDDTMVIYNAGHYKGVLSMTLHGGVNKDFEIRLYNITQAKQESYKQSVSGLGVNNLVNVCLPFYIDVEADDVLRIECQCTTDASDPTFTNASFWIEYLHE